ncbi:MAG: hypothetical protein ACI9BK_000557, partial [Acidimicrobiales bacterium]
LYTSSSKYALRNVAWRHKPDSKTVAHSMRCSIGMIAMSWLMQLHPTVRRPLLAGEHSLAPNRLGRRRPSCWHK